MGLFSGLLSTVAGIGGSFLQAELQRKQQRAASKIALSGFGGQRMDALGGNGVSPQFPPVGSPRIRQPIPGGSVQVAIPSGVSNREFKTAICKAVRERLVHPAQATAELKMRGMKGCVRRMNPLNPRALTRAARRMEGFLRTVKRINRAIPTKTRTVRARTDHSHALKSTGVVPGG